MAAYNFGTARTNLATSLTRLSSGNRINSAAEDPSGAAVSLRLRNQITGTSITKSNLQNVASFLEVQHTSLLKLAEIYKRMDELKARQGEPMGAVPGIINPSNLNDFYNTQISAYRSKINEVKEETFNGVRLFSPDHVRLNLPSNTSQLNSDVEDVAQFPLSFRNERVRQLELIFVVHTTGSMGGTINSLRNSINNFINTVEQRADSWRGKVVDYKDLTEGEPLVVNPFVSSASDLQNQVNSLSPGGGGDLPESLIDGIAQGFDSANWSNDPDIVKGIIAFTDAASKQPVPSNGTSAQIADRIRNAGVTTQIYGVTDDPETANFATAVGANLDPFAASSNMANALGGFLDSLIEVNTGDIDFDTLASYIAENVSKQNTVRNLIQSSELNLLGATSAHSRIADLDVAAESIRLTRANIMQQAGGMAVNQVRVSADSVLTLLR